MSRAGGGDDDGVAFGCWQWQLLGDKIVAKVDMDKRSSQGHFPTQGAGRHEEKLGKKRIYKGGFINLLYQGRTRKTVLI